MRYRIIITITSLILIVSGFMANAQHSINGSVSTELKEYIPGASITLKNKSVSFGTISKENGNFSFENVEEGIYTLTVSHVMYETHTERIRISEANFKNEMLILLTPLTGTLQDVEVIGRASRKYNSDYSFGATRIAIANKDLPQSVSTVTKELMADKQAFQLGSAVSMVSGVAPSSYYNQYNIRGISQNEEGQIINGMRTRQYYFLQPLTANIERVEVIKGPASATFASVDPGGSINLVTKKPLAAARKEISVSAGSFSTLRGTMDFTGPLNKEKTLLYRLNAAYQENGSFRDLIKNKSLLLSPSFTYMPSDKTAINIEMIFSDMSGAIDRGQPIFGAVAGTTNLNSTPISLNLGAPNDYFRSKEFVVMGNISHKFTKKISFITSYMKQTWTEDLQEHRTTNAFANDTAGRPVTSLAGMQFVQRKQNWDIDNVNSYFNIDVKTGHVNHKLLIGYDLHRWEKRKGGGQNAARGFLLKDGSVAGSFVQSNAANYRLALINGSTVPMPNVPYFNLSNPTYTIRNASDYILNVKSELPAALTTSNALYIQEVMQWKRLTVLLSLRQEWFKDITNYHAANEGSFTNAALLPRIGVTYGVTKNINVYATYLEGFQPQSNTVTLMPNTGAYFGTAKSAALFKPLVSDLKEFGVKAGFLKDRLHVNAAVYEIDQKNILMNSNLPAFPDSLTTRGADRSRGFELDIAGFILPNWQVNASYSYIDARIITDNNPELTGARKENTPFNSANIWTRYNFKNSSVLKDLGIGAGAQYSGDKVPWFSRAFNVPGYTLIDAAIYYTPGNSNIQVALNMNNVLNETYWIGAQNYLRLFPGAPRNFLITATYRF